MYSWAIRCHSPRLTETHQDRESTTCEFASPPRRTETHPPWTLGGHQIVTAILLALLLPITSTWAAERTVVHVPLGPGLTWSVIESLRPGLYELRLYTGERVERQPGEIVVVLTNDE